MDFRCQVTAAGAAGRVAADALLVLTVGDDAAEALKAEAPLAAALADALAQGDFERKPAKAVNLRRVADVKAPRVVLAHAAKPEPKALRQALAAGLGLVKGLPVPHVAVLVAGAPVTAELAEALAAAGHEAAYLYRHTKPSAAPAPKLARLTLLAADKAAAAAGAAGLARGAAIGEGVRLARELANRPGNHCTPTMLADEARRMAKANGLKVEVLERKQIEALGMGSFLAVAQGSEEPPRFIVMHYRGASAARPGGKGTKAAPAQPLVLVGKGITFDSGGISLKPAGEMDEMKFDMGGAASVIGAMRAIAALKPAIDVVGIVATCENLPSGRSLKPGDVVTSMSGQTIEVLNTDAEGRLILCDALTYAERFKPKAVVDIATLTGACMIALGGVRSGLFSTDDTLAAELQAAGDAALDLCWRMPMDEDYDETLKSNFADVANVGSRHGGAVTAARFLSRFTGKYRWAHLDVAGTAWKSGAAKGATGRPVGLLVHWVLSQAV